MLATMPTLYGKKYVTDETDTTYIEPGHFIDVNETDDIRELRISDNIQGSMQQLGILINKMQQTTSIYPTTMGNTPTDSSTTATAVQGANQRSNQRSQYKSMTFEYTFLNELYWMIQQMTFVFAKPETGVDLMGTKVFNFNPKLEYFYKPLSQSIETEESKNAKIKQLTGVMQIVATSQNPNATGIVNYFLVKMLSLMGDEMVNYSSKLLDEGSPMQQGNQGSPKNVTPTG
jgi:hypothetical protein